MTLPQRNLSLPPFDYIKCFSFDKKDNFHETNGTFSKSTPFGNHLDERVFCDIILETSIVRVLFSVKTVNYF